MEANERFAQDVVIVGLNDDAYYVGFYVDDASDADQIVLRDVARLDVGDGEASMVMHDLTGGDVAFMLSSVRFYSLAHEKVRNPYMRVLYREIHQIPVGVTIH